MWSDGENESLNVEFIQNNIVLQGIIIAIQHYKMI